LKTALKFSEDEVFVVLL